MSNLEKNCNLSVYEKISCMIGSGHCFLLITLFTSHKSLSQQTRPSFFAWIKLGLAHSLAPCNSKTLISTRWSGSFLNVSLCPKALCGIPWYNIRCKGVPFPLLCNFFVLSSVLLTNTQRVSIFHYTCAHLIITSYSDIPSGL